LDAANHARSLASAAQAELEELWERHREEFERKVPIDSDEPRVWTPAALGIEVKRIGAEILALPERGVRELMDFALKVVSASNPGQEAEPDHTRGNESLLKRGIRPRDINTFGWLKNRGVAALVPEEDRKLTPDDLHEQTIAAIHEAHPDADEQEVRLRVAIRESMGLTPEEEAEVYDKISEALKGGAS
jgi:hypothetical protein